MCNLYSVTKGQQAIRDLFAVKNDRTGNLPPLPAFLERYQRAASVDMNASICSAKLSTAAL